MSHYFWKWKSMQKLEIIGMNANEDEMIKILLNSLLSFNILIIRALINHTRIIYYF